MFSHIKLVCAQKTVNSPIKMALGNWASIRSRYLAASAVSITHLMAVSWPSAQRVTLHASLFEH